jgi:CheY-like chemotaxis protein
VLIAEDNALASEALRVLFEETGHRVTTVATVKAAVATAVADRADLLLLDLGLADGDGLEILRQLAERGALPRVRIALTGRDEPEIVARCYAAGCQAVVLKPPRSGDLLQLTRELLAAAP